MGNNINEKIEEIKDQFIGTTNKTVLAVEGVDDENFYRVLLERHVNDWQAQLCIVGVGGKKSVLEILDKEHSWFGIVDRDEWSDTVIDEKKNNFKNLWITPRFCLENYLIVPNELWAALPQIQRDKIPEGESKLRSTILNEFDRWVAHGVLWSFVNPLWDGLRSRGFKEELLSPDVALNNGYIRKKLNEWHQFLDPEPIMERYMSKFEDVRKLQEDERLKRWVHGKQFYAAVVNPALNMLLGQKSENDRRASIIRTLPLPEDLNGFLKMLNLEKNRN